MFRDVETPAPRRAPSSVSATSAATKGSAESDPKPVVGDDVEAVRERLGDGVPVCTRFASAGLQDDDGRGQTEADASWLAFGEPNGGFRSKTETFG